MWPAAPHAAAGVQRIRCRKLRSAAWGCSGAEGRLRRGMRRAGGCATPKKWQLRRRVEYAGDGYATKKGGCAGVTPPPELLLLPSCLRRRLHDGASSCFFFLLLPGMRLRRAAEDDSKCLHLPPPS
jgi:hypothetical protein